MTRTAPMMPGDVAAARRELGLTQAQLAHALGVDISTVQRWELGLRTPPPYLRLALERLAETAKSSQR